MFLFPAFLLMVNWSVAAPVVVLESPGRLLALGRSSDLVYGNRLRVLTTLMLLIFPLSLLGRAIDMGVVAGSGAAVAVKVLVGILAAPVPVLAVTTLYFELRRVADDDVAPLHDSQA